MFTNIQDIYEWLESYKVVNYTINPDLSVDVEGDVLLGAKDIENLPVQFNRVSRDFNICTNGLTTLKGVPKWVGKNFGCYRNSFTSFEFCPDYVGGLFIATSVNVISLTALNTEIGAFLTLSHPDKMMCPGFESYYTKGYIGSTYISNQLRMTGAELSIVRERCALQQRVETIDTLNRVEKPLKNHQKI